MTPALTQPDPACPLCGPAPANILWEDAQQRVIHVGDSPFPGYIRVIWRTHAAEMTDLSAAERDRLMQTVYQIESLQRRILQPDKINLASLGNQVPHLHWHLIPRWRADPCFPDAIWASASQNPDRLAVWRQQVDEIRARVPALRHAIADALGAA
ncbi:MAG: HIT family protein [Castellaniella sp.]|uniref:HIT family protein n=1 Tax=Castellaniella sp. TaxID=1955812 RepID=UPI003C7867E8